MDKYLRQALEQAKKGLAEGGIPIGSVLVIDNKIVGAGHNQRVQKNSSILHAEMDCLEKAGRLKAADYQKATLYTTLSPCAMCTGAILLYGIKNVVIGENINFMGQEKLLKANDINVKVINDVQCVDMMENFIKDNPSLWNEDIGE
ncbi:nucleoside deaminase [Allofrancisella guangzhouensis]|uniref:Cytidine deaminase n=1 Tax=Allofrancisella guangzhouensis TaxID=594679 RepID=A0A0A8EA09_9GAMM|nr:nucleoside deaminase [Allofrancisella guangzhouensis]AJC48996.1 cytidine deaminase [Allofrancisella guangzhouensis]MBK2027901.1 nucleoside deaminase [Allofrancisella guangzhouensis]MBK2044154.1 nucleoside deaminase [Allofrancisella guangzhouensis]MBK2045134.1 nucleoside deaminase [Allofrancisella guangzhouensis]